MHDVSFFWGFVRIGNTRKRLINKRKIKIKKFYAKDIVQEIEPPYRMCKEASFIRVLPRMMFVIGNWEQQIDETEVNETALAKAVTYGS